MQKIVIKQKSAKRKQGKVASVGGEDEMDEHDANGIKLNG